MRLPVLALLLFSGSLFSDAYRVEIQGAPNEEVYNLLLSTSQLVNLEDTPPASGAALRRRAEADIPRLIKVLHSFAYYNARVAIDYDFEESPWVVKIEIDPGSTYPLKTFQIYGVEEITPEMLGVKPGEPALPATIVEAEEMLLDRLKAKGYPFASIIRREVVADQATKTVSVKLFVSTGPTVTFGATTILGRRTVNPTFFNQKICWIEGEKFDPALVEKTQCNLEASRLFSAVSITYPRIAPIDNRVPMTIQVIEAKHRSIGLGASYSTQVGGGGLFEWENRNFRGRGEKLRFNLNALAGSNSGQLQDSSLSYKIPNFWGCNQDMTWKAAIKHKRSKGFSSVSLSLSGTIDRKLSSRSKISYGGMVKESRDFRSDDNGWFHLFKVPITYRWSNIDDVLEPTRGGSFSACVTPTTQLVDKPMFYNISLLNGTYHKSFTALPRFVIATKWIVGSIIGTARTEIPPNERFYAGSDCTLRGYNFLTVSPLNKEGDPTGGRSMLIGTVEARVRVSEKIGLMGFYDAGNVYRSCFPEFYRKKILQSAGGGIRYYTPVGPVRLDIAFPLNRRTVRVTKEDDEGNEIKEKKTLDKAFQFYFSIGQTF